MTQIKFMVQFLAMDMLVVIIVENAQISDYNTVQ